MFSNHYRSSKEAVQKPQRAVLGRRHRPDNFRRKLVQFQWTEVIPFPLRGGWFHRFGTFRDNILQEMRRRSQPLTFGSTSKAEPRMFQLPVNYRSHAGIVNCAQSVIELITRFWPHSIDTLAPERGTVDGVKPVFFSYEDQDETANIETFLFGSSWDFIFFHLNLRPLSYFGVRGKSIEFGAQQCEQFVPSGTH